MNTVRIINARAVFGLKKLADKSVNCCVTSPPYFTQRDYGVEGQIGLEGTPAMYIARLVTTFRELRRVLTDDGTLWINIGDSYNSAPGGKELRSVVEDLKPKDLIGIPWMLAFALRNDGWYFRSPIIWNKSNAMPDGATDRPTTAHEYIFLFSKQPNYYYDGDAIREKMKESSIARANRGRESVYEAPGQRKQGGAKFKEHKKRGHSRKHDGFAKSWDQMTKAEQQANGANARTVWTMPCSNYRGSQTACFPEQLPERCIKAGCPPGGVVIDPFGGAGTTALAATKLARDSILIEINPDSAKEARDRILSEVPVMASVSIEEL